MSGGPTAAKPSSKRAATIRSFAPTGLRSGWPIGLAAVVAGLVTTTLIVQLAGSGNWLATRSAWLGFATLTVAVVLGAGSLVGLASVPMLGAGVLALSEDSGADWGRALVIGLAWYVAAELAWASIEADDLPSTGGERPPQPIRSNVVLRRRVGEVATVVAVAAVVGLAGTGLATLAPARTSVVKAVVTIAVLAALAVVGQRLSSERQPAPD
jgi:hypothetical protein